MKWHIAFTLKKLIDGTSNQLNCDTWHLKKKILTPNYSFLWTTLMDKGAIDGVSKVHMSHFIQKGRSWKGTEEIRCVKRARPQLPRPFLIKNGRAYLPSTSVIHARPQIHRSSLIKDGRVYWTINEHDPRQKRKEQIIPLRSEASINRYETPIQIK